MTTLMSPAKESLYFKYDGPSFEKEIDLNSLHAALEGLRDLKKTLDPNNIYDISIVPFEKGSFKFGTIFSPKEIVSQTVSTLIATSIATLMFTQGQDFSIKGMNNFGTVNIINIDGEVRTNVPLEVVEQIQNPRNKLAISKIVSPLKVETDKVCIDQTFNFNNEGSIVIHESEKVFFEIPEEQEVGDYKVRGIIYEINLKGSTFKIDLANNSPFTVHINPESEIEISEFLPYVGTSDLLLTGDAVLDFESNIKKFTLNEFQVLQTRIE